MKGRVRRESRKKKIDGGSRSVQVAENARKERNGKDGKRNIGARGRGTRLSHEWQRPRRNGEARLKPCDDLRDQIGARRGMRTKLARRERSFSEKKHPHGGDTRSRGKGGGSGRGRHNSKGGDSGTSHSSSRLAGGFIKTCFVGKKKTPKRQGNLEAHPGRLSGPQYKYPHREPVLDGRMGKFKERK